jgi:hypothetical protein
LTEAIEKQEHETSMDIIPRPLVVINLDDDDITNIDDEVNNELNTLFTSSMSLGENPSMALDIIPLAIFLPFACYIEQDWEENDLLVG